jgi:hypothetical protein
MLIDCGHKVVKIWWKHRRNCGVNCTSCSIADFDVATRRYDLNIGGGMSLCNAQDIFSKKRGRKISLSRALLAAGFDKTERALIWQRYFEEIGGY